MEAKKYTVSKSASNFPDWFKQQAAEGRIKLNLNDDGQVDNVVVYSPTGRSVAHVGDVVMLMKSGLSVISEEKAQKYKVQQKHRTEA